jgi:hypothetical protein
LLIKKVAVLVKTVLTYSVTPCSTVLLEKINGFQLVNSLHFMDPEGSLPHSQVLASCPYPDFQV